MRPKTPEGRRAGMAHRGMAWHGKDGTTRHRTPPSRVPVSLDRRHPSRKAAPWPRPASCTAVAPTARWLVCVCGGLAEYFNLDATLIRILFVVLAVVGGSGLVLYVAMWIIVSKEPQGVS
jgi:phage shock protein C